MKTDCRLTVDDIQKRVVHKFPNSEVYVSDRSTTLIYNSDIQKCILMIKIVMRMLNLLIPRSYKVHEWDCDDYAFEFKSVANRLYPACAFGMVYVDMDDGNRHALNCYLDEFGKWHYIEPQTFNVFDKATNYEPYLVII